MKLYTNVQIKYSENKYKSNKEKEKRETYQGQTGNEGTFSTLHMGLN